MSSKQALHKQLVAAGYSKDDATRIAGDAPAHQDKPTPAPSPEATAPPGRAIDFDRVLAVVQLLIQLLEQWQASGNLTPGQHPATAQALDTLRQLRGQGEGGNRAEGESNR